MPYLCALCLADLNQSVPNSKSPVLCSVPSRGSVKRKNKKRKKLPHIYKPQHFLTPLLITMPSEIELAFHQFDRFGSGKMELDVSTRTHEAF